MWWLMVAAGVGVLVGIGLGVALGFRSRTRVSRIREGVGQLAAGNFGHRVLLPGHDHAARIAEDLNALADQIQREHEAETTRKAAQRLLLANVSHDLRTPIASIAGYVDALQRGLGDDPERYLAVIAAKTDELTELTDDLFYEARLDSGDLHLKCARIDLCELVRRVVLGFEPQFTARGVSVEVDIPEVGCHVDADAIVVTRILENLVSNAIRHGDRMQRFRVSVTEGHASCSVRLANDGAGLPQDVERLFERGVAGGGGGAGLGLSIARELAERMGATVTAERVDADSAAFVLAFGRPSALQSAED